MSALDSVNAVKPIDKKSANIKKKEEEANKALMAQRAADYKKQQEAKLKSLEEKARIEREKAQAPGGVRIEVIKLDDSDHAHMTPVEIQQQ